MTIVDNPELTPREFVLMENERDENRLIREHAEHTKRLELATLQEKNAADVKLAELEARWASWLRIPLTIIKLPIFFVMAIGYCISVVKNEEPGEDFWRYLSK